MTPEEQEKGFASLTSPVDPGRVKRHTEFRFTILLRESRAQRKFLAGDERFSIRDCINIAADGLRDARSERRLERWESADREAELDAMATQ